MFLNAFLSLSNTYPNKYRLSIQGHQQIQKLFRARYDTSRASVHNTAYDPKPIATLALSSHWIPNRPHPAWQGLASTCRVMAKGGLKLPAISSRAISLATGLLGYWL